MDQPLVILIVVLGLVMVGMALKLSAVFSALEMTPNRDTVHLTVGCSCEVYVDVAGGNARVRSVDYTVVPDDPDVADADILQESRAGFRLRITAARAGQTRIGLTASAHGRAADATGAVTVIVNGA